MTLQRVKTMSILAALLLSGLTVAETVVIVHPGNDNELTADYIAKIFLAKTKKFPNDLSAKPIDQLKGSEVREAFLSGVVQKNEAHYRSYWSRMMFTGKAMPPKAVDNDEAVKQMVASTPEAIGYIRRESVDESVRIVYSLPNGTEP